MSAPDFSALDVLVVDAHPVFRQQQRVALSQLGFRNIDEADSGPAAEEKLDRKKYDIILLDVALPEQAALLQKHHAGTAVIMTAKGAEESALALASLRGGAVSVIVKPFMAADFQSRLEPVIGKILKK